MTWFRKESLGQTWDLARNLWRSDAETSDLGPELAALKAQIPAPVIWLFGKTQSGKTSLIRLLTGAEDAAIGNGFQPCTRTSREYPFPTAELPVVRFLDTRGVEEPGYDPTEDLTQFDTLAHVLLVTVRVTDFAHGHLRESLRRIRAANPTRPVILVLSCLHEIEPTAQHPQPYPFDPLASAIGQPPVVVSAAPEVLLRLVREQAQQFEGLCDRIVPLDLTRPEEGYTDRTYGEAVLKRVLLASLPDAYRETMRRVAELTQALAEAHLKRAAPIIVKYSTLAATAGTIPVPFLDLLLIPALQVRMVTDLATLYGQPWTARRFLETAASLGIGLVARQAVREVVKFIPFVGSAAGAAIAYASTYALGRAYCEYFEQVHQGHIPGPDAVKALYHEQFAAAEKMWFQSDAESQKR
ncbi:MAG: GTP-binding DUF697 domain-containing protein [Bacteroidales bacterium]|nr:GTP-binding DUF697 domain-containing protein [Bacteroidales bacterium]